MPFFSQVGESFTIDNTFYTIAEHPHAPGMPFGQEGRAAEVYQLLTPTGDTRALKVFKLRYRLPALTGQAHEMAPLATFPGLRVCERTVLSATRYKPLLQQYPDLTYAVLMPWIEGPTWTQVLGERRPLEPDQSLFLAQALVAVLARMEEKGLAHCDLSGSNILLPALDSPSKTNSHHPVELVDIEQLYSSDLKRPEVLTVSSAGYAHKAETQDLWGATSDRFAGAMLLAEMLGWCDPQIRDASWGESYFAQDEIQKDIPRYQSLVTSLEIHWGHTVVSLFERAWNSDTLLDCPTFGEWMVVLPETVPKRETSTTAEPTQQEEKSSGASEQTNEATLRVLMDVARHLEEQSNLSGALENYRRAQTLAPQKSELANELAAIVQNLSALIETRANQDASATPPTDVRVPTPAENELASLFDDGLSTFQNDNWREAVELLREVVRCSPEYTRNGWQAKKLLVDAQQRARPFWQRAVHYGARILVSALLVLILVVGTFIITYLTFVRPIVTDSLFTFARPLLHELTDISGGAGCWSLSEREINEGLKEMVPSLVSHNNLNIQIHQAVFSTQIEIGGQLIWLNLYPPTGYHGEDFAVGQVEMSNLLKLLLSPDDLATFINEYVADEVIGSGLIRSVLLDPDEGDVWICAQK